jgi:hypothetical protein
MMSTSVRRADCIRGKPAIGDLVVISACARRAESETEGACKSCNPDGVS